MTKKILIICFFILLNCLNSHAVENFFKLINPINDDNSINVFIEISAGDTFKYQLSKETSKLELEYDQAGERKIKYLPYPFNYGVLPQTYESIEIGADGDPLDVILIGPRKKNNNLYRVDLIGILYLNDGNEIDNKILAIDNEEIFTDVKNIEDLNLKYPGIIEIITIWLKNYKGGDVLIGDIKKKKKALNYIKESRNRYLKTNGN